MRKLQTEPFADLEIPEGFSTGIRGAIEVAAIIVVIFIASGLLIGTALADLVRRLPGLVVRLH